MSEHSLRGFKFMPELINPSVLPLELSPRGVEEARYVLGQLLVLCPHEFLLRRKKHAILEETKTPLVVLSAGRPLVRLSAAMMPV